MPTPKKSLNHRARPERPNAQTIITELKKLATKGTLDGMARYGLPSARAFGVAVRDMQKLAKRIGKDHALASELWSTGWYEARMLAAFVGEPDRVTSAEMDRWCRDFDNWGICDTVCFHLWDRTPLAWKKIKPWTRRREEFVKRTGFVLMACLAGHDKIAIDELFLTLLPLIEQGAADERNFVKKGVSWALRMIGRRSEKLNAASVQLAQDLAQSKNAAARWIGNVATRELTSPSVVKRFARKRLK